MIAERYAFDTNIFFYSINTTTGSKHIRALDMVRAMDPVRSVILLQTLGELGNAILKRKPALFPAAETLIRNIVALSVPSHPDDVLSAMTVRQIHNIPLWDAVLWATANRMECKTFFTEDLQDGRTLGGVTFRNPFTLSQNELDALLA